MNIGEMQFSSSSSCGSFSGGDEEAVAKRTRFVRMGRNGVRGYYSGGSVVAILTLLLLIFLCPYSASEALPEGGGSTNNRNDPFGLDSNQGKTKLLEREKKSTTNNNSCLNGALWHFRNEFYFGHSRKVV